MECEGRRAKAGCPNGKGCVGSDAGRQANARRVGSTQRRKEGRQAASHKESPCGVAYLAPLREIRLPRPHSSGRTPIGGRRPLGNTPSHFEFRSLTTARDGNRTRTGVPPPQDSKTLRSGSAKLRKANKQAGLPDFSPTAKSEALSLPDISTGRKPGELRVHRRPSCTVTWSTAPHNLAVGSLDRSERESCTPLGRSNSPCADH